MTLNNILTGNGGFVSLLHIKVILHLMWAAPSPRRNHSQAKCRTRENKKLRNWNSHKDGSFWRCLGGRASPRVAPAPATPVSLGKLLRNANHWVLPRPTKLGTLGVGPSHLCFNMPSRGLWLCPVKGMAVQSPHLPTSRASGLCFELKNISIRGWIVCFHLLGAPEMIQCDTSLRPAVDAVNNSPAWHYFPKADKEMEQVWAN